MAPRKKPPKALVVGAFGARGTGKTAWLTTYCQQFPRLAVWDYKGDPNMSDWGTGTRSLAQLVRLMMAPTFLVRYIPDRSKDARLTLAEQFERFCQACFQVSCLTMFVDELPAVTAANRAPPAWRECVNVGREYTLPGRKGIQSLGIVATAQRPTECDKSFISNLDVVHTGRQAFQNDAALLAKSLGCPVDEVLQLPDLVFIEKSAASPEVVRGKLEISDRNIRVLGGLAGSLRRGP